MEGYKLQSPLVEYLQSIPKSQWTEKNHSRRSFLHAAILYRDADAIKLLLSHSKEMIDDQDYLGETAVFIGCDLKVNTRCLQLMCAAGANLTLGDGFYKPIDVALHSPPIARFLISHGVRLASVSHMKTHHITKELRIFEYQILRCRSAVISLLKAKDVCKLWRWDRFLLKHVALQVWLSREEWDC